MADWIDFKGPGFTMLAPSDWYVFSSPQFQAMFVSPTKGGEERPNLMVTIRPVQPDVTVEAVAQNARKTQEKEYNEFAVIREGTIDTETGKGYDRAFSWLKEDQNARIIQRQVMYVVGGLLYTFTATRTDRPESAGVDPVFDRMLASVRFT